MGDAWASGIGAYEAAAKRYHRAPEHESPERESTARLRGSVQARLNAMEPPVADVVQPGGSVHVKRPHPAEQTRTVRSRMYAEDGPVKVLDEIALDELEHKYLITSTIANSPSSSWDAWLLNGLSGTGTTVTSRVGNSVISRRVCVRGFVYNAAANSETMHCRIVILRDTQSRNGTIGTSAASPFVGGGSFYTNDSYNPSTVGDDKRYQILADRTFCEQKLVSQLRIPFAFCIDLPDEICTMGGTEGYLTPAYFLCHTYSGGLVSAMHMTAEWIYVDP